MSKNIIFLSTYPPRACGIATFTADLIKNLKNKFPSDNYKIAAINDENYKYGNEVSFVLNQFDRKSYIRLANSINNSNTDLVVIEHEYGIYGGDCGEYLLDFINNLKIPFITTLHTILSKPNKNQREILKVLGSKSKKIITFGLLDPGKGIEYAIEAISQVVETHPKVLYLILGETHPCVRKAHGESYRTKLQNLVSELHIEDNVRFVNKYLTKKEIVQYLTLSDIYVTPYLATEQAVSGTLAYAAGYGKVIVSTPYRYAKEMLKDGRGMLAKSKDSSSLAKAILYLLNNPTARKSMEKKMFNTGKKMKWPYVAQQYENLFSNTIKTSKITKQVV